MNNFERGEFIFEEAELRYERLLQAYEKKRWNIVIRDAQEVVELLLKGVLKIMGIEHPKIHDVAPVFIKVINEKGIELDKSVAERIKRISKNLAEERAPAFYGEKFYTRKQAEEAKQGAEWTFRIARELANKLR